MERIESIDRDALIQDLKEKGLDDPATKETLTAWVIEQEALADPDRTARGRINVSLAKARLYRDAGLEENAQAHFEDALEMAWNERMDDLYSSIQSEK
jgi:hypothetical protein